MGSENYLRTETVHIDEASCNATSTIQWFAENKNKKGEATHPITHNNKLSLYICGQEGFAAIAKDIAEAKESIDLVCWGFDPGMELLRNEYKWSWPRSETYGDLLIAAGRRGVRVRLLVWYSLAGGLKQKHMPGHTHGLFPWRTQESDLEIQKLHSKGSLQLVREHARENRHKKEWNISSDKLAAMAREEYCRSWYKAAFKNQLHGISIRLRHGDCDKNEESLSHERTKPGVIENYLMEHQGTHHQKPILIDFGYQQGEKAVGYVMGLNSLTDYWDTEAHDVENPLREQGGDKTLKEETQGVEGKHNFETLKPYRDYACRIDGGGALIPLHENFESAWKRAGGEKIKRYVCSTPPAALLRKAAPGNSSVQIVRTQPEEDDFTIKDIYFNATRVAAAGTGYLYLENQYFQYEEWAQHLLAVRKKVIAGWNRNCGKIGKGAEDIPVLHVFVVIPAPEAAAMIPRTYETLATLGQQDGLTGQVEMIDGFNGVSKAKKPEEKQPAFRGVSVTQVTVPEVVTAANKIDKPSMDTLEDMYGLRVCVAVLNACGHNLVRGEWHYREIYIHSKLLLIDDSFFTLGSANLNQRSMAADSEINLATNDRQHATALRKRIWTQLATEENNGGSATPQEIENTFVNWVNLMKKNKDKQKAKSPKAKKKQMEGFIVPLDDRRSSTARHG